MLMLMLVLMLICFLPQISLLQSKVVQQPTFLDYIRGG